MNSKKFNHIILCLIMGFIIVYGWKSTYQYNTRKEFEHNLILLEQFKLDQAAIAQDACEVYIDEHATFAEGVDYSVYYKPHSYAIPTIPLSTTEDIKVAASNLLVPFTGNLSLNGKIAFNIKCVYSVKDADVIEYELKNIVPNLKKKIQMKW